MSEIDSKAAPQLVTLNDPAESTGPAFFCFPAGGTTPVSLYLLARHLAPARKVCSCVYDGVRNDVQPQHKVEDIALNLLPGILDLQSTGPYSLGGFCLGGLVALELARLLADRGEAIAMVVMLDTIPPVRQHGRTEIIKPFEPPKDPEEKRNFELFLESVRVMDQSMEEKLAALPYETAAKIRRARDNHNFAGATYSCPRTAVPITVIHTGYDTRKVYSAWSRYTTAAFDQVTLAGNTQTMLDLPLVETVGFEVGQALDRADKSA